ncbi:MAG TPA: hypothetical protein VG650_08660 [Mycobacteriales bacterium]|nr:hypothetical protein [Mycobacteriales bacterium]
MRSSVQAWWRSLGFRIANDRDRGDVPGWVLITMMTAGIVVALWVVAEPTLRNLLTNALNIAGDPSQ